MVEPEDTNNDETRNHNDKTQATDRLGNALTVARSTPHECAQNRPLPLTSVNAGRAVRSTWHETALRKARTTDGL